MCRIISLINEKGGVGKSSITYSCAWELAREGCRVLIIDMDGQTANISYIAGVSTEGCITMYDVLVKGSHMKDAVIRVAKAGDMVLDIIPANVMMADAMNTVKITKMKSAVKEVADDYDYIFIDVNPSPDKRHALTLAVCDHIGIIMLPDVLSLEANTGIIESVEEVKDGINTGLNIAGIILNQYDGRTNLSKAVCKRAEKMADYLNTSVFRASIRKSVVMGESASAHVGVTEYAPRAEISRDMRQFTEELKEVCI